MVGAAEGQSALVTSPEASLANTSHGNTASRFGSSRYMPGAHNYVDKAPREGEGEHSPMGGVRRGGILTVPKDYELALSLHLAKALRRAVLLALADNAAVAARYWKIGHSEEEKNKDCPEGTKYVAADKYGSGCRPECRPGSYSDTAGAAECTACVATSADEHAVSMLMHGPWMPSE